MDGCIRNGVTSTETHLPGGLNVRRRAPHLYRRLQKGFYPTIEVDNSNSKSSSHSHSGEGPAGEVMSSSTGLVRNGNVNGDGSKKRIGRRNHDLHPVPRRTTPVFPGIEYLSCMAIAVSFFPQSSPTLLQYPISHPSWGSSAKLVGQRSQCIRWESSNSSVSPILGDSEIT